MDGRKKFIKKKLLSSFFLITSFFLLSCSDSENESADQNETSTLRSLAESKYDSTLWTEELEYDRLTADVSAVEGVSLKISLFPLALLAAPLSKNEKIFPSMKNFTSLDTSLLSNELKTMLISFCDCISSFESADAYFVSECRYSLALFYNDFSRIFSSCFNLKKESDNGKNEKIFESYVFGEPFLNGVYYEVPVKFFSDQADLTVTVYCVESSESWLVDQIQIVDWEIKNGEK